METQLSADVIAELKEEDRIEEEDGWYVLHLKTGEDIRISERTLQAVVDGTVKCVKNAA